MKNAQLADLLRPTTIDDIVGQDHLFGKKGVIRRMLESGRMTNMIFFGPPGTGKTTAATILANASGMVFRKLNATTASLADVKAIVEALIVLTWQNICLSIETRPLRGCRMVFT